MADPGDCCCGVCPPICGGTKTVPENLFLTGRDFPPLFSFLNGTFPFNFFPTSVQWAVDGSGGGVDGRVAWSGLLCPTDFLNPDGTRGMPWGANFFGGGWNATANGIVLYRLEWTAGYSGHAPYPYIESCEPLIIQFPPGTVYLRSMSFGIPPGVEVVNSASLTISE